MQARLNFSSGTIIVRVKRSNDGVGVYFSGGRRRTGYGEWHAGFRFSTSIAVGSLRYYKVLEFGVVLIGGLG